MRVDNTHPSRCRTLEDLNSRISAHLHIDNAGSGLESIALMLSQFGQQGLAGYLDYLITNDDEMSALARRSYIHGNGFYKIPLVTSPTHTVRIHIWRGDCAAEENLHTHRWPLASAVVHGTLTAEYWADDTSRNGIVYNELMYRNKEDEPTLLGECRIRLEETREHLAGEHYWMMADKLHRIVNVGKGLTITLMMRPINTRSWTRLIPFGNPVPDVKPSYLGVSELRVMLVMAYGALTGQTKI